MSIFAREVLKEWKDQALELLQKSHAGLGFRVAQLANSLEVVNTEKEYNTRGMPMRVEILLRDIKEQIAALKIVTKSHELDTPQTEFMDRVLKNASRLLETKVL